MSWVTSMRDLRRRFRRRSAFMVLCALAATTGACSSSLREASSAETGCHDELTISNEQSGPSGDTWTVTCHGHVWDCAREEEPFEADAWEWGRLRYHHFSGTQTGETYCLQRGLD
jgi:hypothetical protein